jgi:hypothetical protein
VAFLKNRTSSIFVGGLIILAILGIFNSISSSPINFLKGVAVFVLMSVVIYFVVRKLSNSGPQSKEQRAFLKAAKKSKKRLQQKNGVSQAKNSSHGTLTTLKKNIKTNKKPSAHLTVIEGKKSKKKNRASL